jgi:hypothetical protein
METVRGRYLCLNDSWLVERVRGSHFRAARRRREGFSKATHQLRKSPVAYRCLPAGVATTSMPAYLESTTRHSLKVRLER